MATFTASAPTLALTVSASCERKWRSCSPRQTLCLSGHLVQRQTQEPQASQATNGRMTTLLMNALIICVCGWVGGVYGFMTVSFGVAAKQTPLSFKTHIFNTCWLIRFVLSQSPLSLSVFPQRPNSIWRSTERRHRVALSELSNCSLIHTRGLHKRRSFYYYINGRFWL